ncbi:hypothetical protein CS542_04540 [Pedobacter sp. IW39]|nr:hypothetical protein CS542_04540 [Pedobacter sp. IW39]
MSIRVKFILIWKNISYFCVLIKTIILEVKVPLWTKQGYFEGFADRIKFHLPEERNLFYV